MCTGTAYNLTWELLHITKILVNTVLYIVRNTVLRRSAAEKNPPLVETDPLSLEGSCAVNDPMNAGQEYPNLNSSCGPVYQQAD